MKDKMTSEQAFKFVEEMGYSKPLWEIQKHITQKEAAASASSAGKWEIRVMLGPF
jgi:hypothetical protein